MRDEMDDSLSVEQLASVITQKFVAESDRLSAQAGATRNPGISETLDTGLRGNDDKKERSI